MPKRNESIGGSEAPPASNAELLSLALSLLGGPLGAMDALQRKAKSDDPKAQSRAAQDEAQFGPLLESVVSPRVKAQRRAVAPTPAPLKPLEQLQGLVSKAQNFDQRPTLNQRINNRDTLYHATWHDPVKSIVSEGITPKMGPQQKYSSMHGTNGVSTSRVPVVNYFRTPLSLELDPKKMPKTRSIAESAFRKGYGPEKFEFENRTFGQAISPEAIKQLTVRPSYMRQGQTAVDAFKELEYSGLLDKIPTNIPIRFLNAKQQYLARLLGGE